MDAHVPGLVIQGQMRRHQRTIRGLARQLYVTQKRVREVRQAGITGTEDVRSWLAAITAKRVTFSGYDDKVYFGWAYAGGNGMTHLYYTVPSRGICTAYLTEKQVAERIAPAPEDELRRSL